MAKRAKAGDKESAGFYQAIRDVLIESMRRGQFPTALVGLIVIVILIKMPGEDVSTLAFKVLDHFEKGVLVGWGLWIVTIVAWAIHGRYQRRTIAGEMMRIAEERNRLQERGLGEALESSED